MIIADGEGIGYKLTQLEDGNYTINSKTDGATGAKFNTVRTDGYYWFSTGGTKTIYGDGYVSGNQVGNWTISEVGTKTYTISLPAGTDGITDGQVCGVVNDHSEAYSSYSPNWGIYPDVEYTGNEAACQFQFITAADYAAWKAEYARYDAAQTLNGLIETASGLGLDVTSEQAVYNNTNSTLEQLNAAISSLEDKIANAATWENPQDVTSKWIVNPTPTKNGDGWNWSKTDGRTFDASNNVAEYWSAGAAGAQFDQTIHQLPAGVYQLSAQAFCRTDMTSKLFVNQDSVQLVQYPSSKVTTRSGAKDLFNNGEGKDSIFFFTAVPSDVKIGIKVDSLNGDHWTVWRGFTLKSYGTSVESFRHLASSYAAGWEDLYGGDTYCYQYWDSVQNAIGAADAATTVDEAVAAYYATKKAIENLKTNIALLKKLDQLYQDLDAKNASDYQDEELSAAIEEAQKMYEDLSASNAEIQAMINKLNVAEQNAIDNSAKPGSNITSGKITNPTFSESEGSSETAEDGTYYKTSAKGWTVKGGRLGNGGVSGGTSGACEIWAGNGSVKQNISLKKGAYELRLKNFYRTVQDANDAYRYFKTNNDSNTVHAVVYGAGNRAKFQNIFVNKFNETEKGTFAHADGFQKSGYEGDTIWSANTVDAAKDLFNSPTYGNNYYTSAKFVSTGKADSVTIGIEIRNILPYAWAIWDNIELIYTGSDLTSLTNAIKETAQNNTDLAAEPMSSAAKTQLNAALSAANAATAEADIYAAAKLVAAAVPVAEASATRYDSLANALAELNDAIENYTDGTKAAKDAAAALKAQIEKALTDGSIADADVAKTVKAVADAITELRKPDTGEASMKNPIDMTSMIVNPKFDADGTGSLGSATGWSTVGTPNSDFVNNCIAQTWNRDVDVTQVVSGLPKGLYQLVAQGWYMDGNFAADTAAYYGDSLKCRTKLYAGKDSVNLKPYIWIPTDEANKSIMKSAPSTDGSWNEFTDKTDGSIYYFPNDRQQVKLRFDNVVDVNSTDLNHDGDPTDPAWLNTLYTYVDSDTLKIGFKTINHATKDWAAVTNFQLFYFGDGEDTKDTAKTTGINDVNAAKTVARRIYTVDGREVDALQKGVNIIKMTDVNGKTTVKKVIVR